MINAFRSIRHTVKSWLTVFVGTIQAGPLQGRKWVITSGRKFLEGRYEPFKTGAVLRVVRAGDVVFDVGAHVGYYTTVAAVTVGPTGHVYAFEPRPLNLRYLRRHVQVNRLENVTVIAAGVMERSGAAQFEARTGTGTGHLSAAGRLAVKVVSLDELFDQGTLPPPNFIKIDVEGGEIGVLGGARKVIAATRPNLLIATHGPETHSFVLGFLGENNYRHEILDKQGSSGDTEILAQPN